MNFSVGGIIAVRSYFLLLCSLLVEHNVLCSKLCWLNLERQSSEEGWREKEEGGREGGKEGESLRRRVEV